MYCIEGSRQEWPWCCRMGGVVSCFCGDEKRLKNNNWALWDICALRGVAWTNRKLAHLQQSPTTVNHHSPTLFLLRRINKVNEQSTRLVSDISTVPHLSRASISVPLVPDIKVRSLRVVLSNTPFVILMTIGCKSAGIKHQSAQRVFVDGEKDIVVKHLVWIVKEGLVSPPPELRGQVRAWTFFRCGDRAKKKNGGKSNWTWE